MYYSKCMFLPNLSLLKLKLSIRMYNIFKSCARREMEENINCIIWAQRIQCLLKEKTQTSVKHCARSVGYMDHQLKSQFITLTFPEKQDSHHKTGPT